MENILIKHFSENPRAPQTEPIEEQINKFLLDNPEVKFVDLKYSSAVWEYEDFFSAILIYKVV